MFNKLQPYLSVLIILYWLIHVYEGHTSLDRANRSCDPIYWLGDFVDKNIVSGFIANESQGYYNPQIASSMLGRGCFYLSSRLFKAVNPRLDFDTTQIFNTNETQQSQNK